MWKSLQYSVGLLLLSASLGGCGIIYTVRDPHLHEDVLATITEFKQRDPGLPRFFDMAHGYAVFPSVGRTACTTRCFGRGELLIKGHWDGNCSVIQDCVGTPLHGKSYRELIFFKDAIALDRFESDELEFGAHATAVKVPSSAAGNVDYRKGVLVIIEAKGGAILTPTICGQKFHYQRYCQMLWTA
jgi:hypothetical protein